VTKGLNDKARSITKSFGRTKIPQKNNSYAKFQLQIVGWKAIEVKRVQKLY
jgi:hypothetical protein